MLALRACLLVFISIFAALSNLEANLSEVKVGAEGAILINAETGAVLYEKNSRVKLYPASITKIATAAYALNVKGDNLDRKIAAEQDSIASISEIEMERSNYSLPSYWLIPGASHIGIKRGEILTLEDLLFGTMIASGGDASNVIAQYIGGTIPTFMRLLNEYLKEIGCVDTVFKNPHGLHHPHHMTTPFDMAVLTSEAMKNKKFQEIVKTVRYVRPETNKQKPTTLIQTNRLLRKGKSYYSKAIGVKTGYTSKAQNTLVAAAREGNRTLIAVLMKSRDREGILSDAVKLFEAAFKEKQVKRRVFRAGPQKSCLKIPNASKGVSVYLKEDAVLEFFPSEVKKLKCQISWDNVELPIAENQRVGELKFVDQDTKILATHPLFAVENVGYSASFRLKRFVSGHFWVKMLAGGMALLLIFGLVYELKRGS